MLVLNWQDLFKDGFSFGNAKSDVFSRGTALSVGSFDGPHRGHFAIFEKIIACASLSKGIVTFEKSLSSVKQGKDYKGDISSLDERLGVFRNLGFDFVLVINFDEDFRKIEGEEFFRILKDKLNMKYIVEGVDFRCGHKGAFSKPEIERFCNENGIGCLFIELVKDDGKRISSSLIRALLEKNLVKKADELLGRK